MMDTIDLVKVRGDLINHDYKPGVKGYMYEVFWGEKLLGRWTEPIYSACRALLKLDPGLSGSSPVVRFFRPGVEYPDMIVRNLEAASKLTVLENASTGPRVVKYIPYHGCE